MVCLDTDFIIAYMRHDDAATSKAGQLREDRKTLITVTAVTAMELYRGAFRSKYAAAEAKKVTAVLDTFDAVLNLDHHCAKVAGEIDASLKSNPRGLRPAYCQHSHGEPGNSSDKEHQTF